MVAGARVGCAPVAAGAVRVAAMATTSTSHRRTCRARVRPSPRDVMLLLLCDVRVGLHAGTKHGGAGRCVVAFGHAHVRVGPDHSPRVPIVAPFTNSARREKMQALEHVHFRRVANARVSDGRRERGAGAPGVYG